MTNTGMARRWFGNDKPPATLERLNILYGTPSLQYLDHTLLRLHDKMYHKQTVYVMLYTTEEVKIPLMSHPYGYCKLSDANVISYAMIKLSNFGGIYNKAIERWQSNTKEDKNIWEKFRQHLIVEYENLLAEGVGTTLGQEGYGMEFNSTESTMDKSSINESIVRYAERATAE